ncbi:sigma factor [Paenibacillus lautus]|uniref:sigma factor n=1 Tax=Paenibacillus lautus TaxID=1401 RepID=UPI003D28590C
MNDHNWLVGQFEAHRKHLQAVAYRMLGSLSEADDAVQESWIRLSRSDTSGVENMGGWLTTIVSRVCLDICFGLVVRGARSLFWLVYPSRLLTPKTEAIPSTKR